MVVKKFYGNNTREALRQVRDALGPDALILSNRQVPGGGIEIMAVADTDVAQLTSGPGQLAPATPQDRTAQVHAPQADAALQAREPDWPQVTRRRGREPSPALDREEPFLISHSAPPRAAPLPAPKRYVAPEWLDDGEAATQPVEAPPAATPAAARPDPAQEDVLNEVRMLRTLLEGQLAGFAWGEFSQKHPERLDALRQMLAAGFSPRLARELMEPLPPGLNGSQINKWLRQSLQQQLQVSTAADELVDRGGVLALVGPTGVGKTTTVAKLAARYTLKYGAQHVALISTDSYRIGAHDQLRIYGKILNVPVYSVKDEDDLQLTLADLTNRHLILIDTVGMSQRDQRLVEQIAMLSGQGERIQRLLLMAANTQAGTLDDVVRRYSGEHAHGLIGCVLTKIDESLSLGASLDAILRYRLPLHYVTNGQRVPEDLHLPNPLYLIDRAFKNQADSDTFALRQEEYPLYMAAQPSNHQAMPAAPAPATAPAAPMTPLAQVLRSNRKGPSLG